MNFFLLELTIELIPGDIVSECQDVPAAVNNVVLKLCNSVGELPLNVYYAELGT